MAIEGTSVRNLLAATDDDQESLLIGSDIAKPVRRWRRLLVGAALALGAVTALAVKKAVTPCPILAHLDGDALVSLAQVHTTEMSGMLEHQDHDVIKDWLLDASQPRDSKGYEQLQKNMQHAISEAMDTKDPEKAKTLVEKAAARSLSRWHAKRQDLKSYIKSHRRGLKGKMSLAKGQQATTAECVFNVEQATAQIAALASNIADSAKTCIKGTNFLETSGKVCVVNLAGIAYSVSTIAASLSMAAGNCATTLMPNYLAMCVGGAAGVAASLSQFASAAALTSAACAPEQLAPGAAAGVTPSNFGQPGGPGANVELPGVTPLPPLPPPPTAPAADVRRLHAKQNATAHARRLVFGGGKGSDMTQCVVDATSVSWWLAQAGLAINAAANSKDQASCKLPLIKAGKLAGTFYKYSESVCAVDVMGAINGFGQAMYYLQMAATQCSDQLNLRAMCGAGIDGMVSALAGSGAGGTAAWLNCYEAYGWESKDGELKRNKIKAKAQQVVMTAKVNGLKQEGNFGRRLEAQDDNENIRELRQRFGSPEAAWKSIGFDMEDPNAAFRSARAAVDPEELVSLVGAQEQDHAEGSGLFGGPHMCS